MVSSYQEAQRNQQVAIHGARSDLFDGTPTGARFMGKPREFVLTDGTANLNPVIRRDVLTYFAEHRIQWWRGHRPTGHLLSSQIACINHLFGLRRDRESALAVLQSLDPEMDDALPIACDNDGGYVAFEATSDIDRLNEGTVQRGANNTSLDAAMMGRRRNGQRVLVAIEWKFTEHYGDTDKSSESSASNGAGPKGEIRQARYNALILASRQLGGRVLGDYYREPFYQLMRQTLLAEQLVAHKGEERLGADDFLHLHVIPRENHDLLHKAYQPHGLDMESHWRSLLVDQWRYRIVTPSDLLTPLAGQETQAATVRYLAMRYWLPPEGDG